MTRKELLKEIEKEIEFHNGAWSRANPDFADLLEKCKARILADERMLEDRIDETPTNSKE